MLARFIFHMPELVVLSIIKRWFACWRNWRPKNKWPVSWPTNALTNSARTKEAPTRPVPAGWRPAIRTTIDDLRPSFVSSPAGRAVDGRARWQLAPAVFRFPDWPRLKSYVGRLVLASRTTTTTTSRLIRPEAVVAAPRLAPAPNFKPNDSAHNFCVWQARDERPRASSLASLEPTTTSSR